MKIINKFIIYGSTLIIMLLFIAPPIFAQGGQDNNPSFHLKLVVSTADSMTMEVWAENVTELYGAEFQLKFDPAMVSVQDFNTEQDGIQIEAGSLLPTNLGFVVVNKVDEVEGTIIFAITLLNPAPPVTGSGSLARISFTALHDGLLAIDIEHSKLVAANLQTVSGDKINLVMNDVKQSTPAIDPLSSILPVLPAVVPKSSFPWAIVGTVVLILGGLILAGGMVINIPKAKTSRWEVAKSATLISHKRKKVAPVSSALFNISTTRHTRPSAFKEIQW